MIASVRAVRACAVALLMALCPAAWAQPVFKCGESFQDRPCAAGDSQQRYSHATGRFSISQVNPNTDRDCAASAAEAIVQWRKVRAQGVDKLKAELDAQPGTRNEKSRLRDQYIALAMLTGPEVEVRSDLESQCMTDKRRRGLPTDRQLGDAAALSAARDAAAAARSQSYYERSNAMEARAAVQMEEHRIRAEQARQQALQRRAAHAHAQAAAEAERRRISSR